MSRPAPDKTPDNLCAMELILRSSVVTEGDRRKPVHAQGIWEHRRDSSRGASGLSRSTNAGRADGQYERDNRTLCRDLHWLFRKLMDTTTLLSVIIIVLILFGGGWYGRGRWYYG
jgi:hypothetical protein